MDFSNLISTELIQIGLGLISALIGYAVHTGTAYLRAKTKNENTKAVLGIVDSIVTSAVKKTEQRFRKQMERSVPNRKLTAKEKFSLMNNAVDVAKDNLTKSTKKHLSKAVPDIQQYIICKVEEAVLDMKASKQGSQNKDHRSVMENFGLGK